VLIEDPREEVLPDVPAFFDLQDPESGERVIIDASSKTTRDSIAVREAKRRAELEEIFRSAGLDYIRIKTDRPYIDTIVRFFRERSRRFSR
jgi:uncharacterized protein (DUF58 family)